MLPKKGKEKAGNSHGTVKLSASDLLHGLSRHLRFVLLHGLQDICSQKKKCSSKCEEETFQNFCSGKLDNLMCRGSGVSSGLGSF